MDAVEAPTEVAVRYIVSDLLYPLIKNNQPHYRVRWKYYRKANEQTDEPRQQLLQDVPKLVRNFEADWNVEFVRAEDGWKILSFGLEVGATRGLPQNPKDFFRRTNRERVMSAAIREEE